VNAVDRFGYTPLLYAADIDFGDAETATVLLQAGADPTAKHKSGKTALMLARDYPTLGRPSKKPRRNDTATSGGDLHVAATGGIHRVAPMWRRDILAQ
jgi:hypothetical protein